jgi:hypothetical protein
MDLLLSRLVGDSGMAPHRGQLCAIAAQTGLARLAPNALTAGFVEM